MALAPRGGVPRSVWPARRDLMLSLSGVLLAIFMWAHMVFVSSILISDQAMWRVARLFEGAYFFDRPYPVLVSLVVAAISLLLVLHVVLAIRRIPHRHAQYARFRAHSAGLRHPDTQAWWIQLVTGFVVLILVGPHLLQMFLHPEAIGPYQSAERVWSGHWWPLYLLLLWAVEWHAAFGLYRAAMKWGWPSGQDPVLRRRWLNRCKWFLVVFFIALGTLTLGAELRLGYQNRDTPGRIYQPDERPHELISERHEDNP